MSTGNEQSPDAERRGRVNVALVIALSALLVGLVVAVLGVMSAVDAVSEHDEIESYATARDAATSRLESAKQAVTVGEQLCGCNVQSRDLARQQLDAAVAQDSGRYNALVDQRNALAAQGNDLLEQLNTLP